MIGKIYEKFTKNHWHKTKFIIYYCSMKFSVEVECGYTV
jgi:hypothetical protein